MQLRVRTYTRAPDQQESGAFLPLGRGAQGCRESERSIDEKISHSSGWKKLVFYRGKISEDTSQLVECQQYASCACSDSRFRRSVAEIHCSRNHGNFQKILEPKAHVQPQRVLERARWRVRQMMEIS